MSPVHLILFSVLLHLFSSIYRVIGKELGIQDRYSRPSAREDLENFKKMQKGRGTFQVDKERVVGFFMLNWEGRGVGTIFAGELYPLSLTCI